MSCKELISNTKNHFLKYKSLYISYLITVLVFVILMLLLAVENCDFNIIHMAILLFNIPYAIIGIIIFMLIFKKHKHSAIGILLGALTPFIAIILITGKIGFLHNGLI